MRNFILLIVFCLLSYSTFGQVTTLEQKRGFKEIKLGDPHWKWESKMVYFDKNNQGLKRYSYTGDCCQRFYNQDVSRIMLTFQADTIVQITGIIEDICTDKMAIGEETTCLFDPTVFKDLKNKVTYTIGEPAGENAIDNENKVQLITVWAGKNTILKLTYIYTTESDDIIFLIADSEVFKSKAKEGF